MKVPSQPTWLELDKFMENKDVKVVAPKLALRRGEDGFKFVLYNTEIVEVLRDDTYILNMEGYWTKTTKRRINKITGFNFCTVKGEVKIKTDVGLFKFVDGMKLTRAGSLLGYWPENKCHVDTWFERDRAHVHLFCEDANTTVLEWVDDEVNQAVEDGFLNPKDWEGSAKAYAKQQNLIY